MSASDGVTPAHAEHAKRCCSGAKAVFMASSDPPPNNNNPPDPDPAPAAAENARSFSPSPHAPGNQSLIQM